jgi:ribosomal peptide maturation radical SAM protein 1
VREIALVNMPFADRKMPSFALSQLAELVNRDLGDRFRVRVCYANHDLVRFLGPSLYDTITDDLSENLSGIGDWLFRAIAFPDDEDNAAEYFSRFFADPEHAGFRDTILRRRGALYGFCVDLVDRYRLAEADVVGFTSMFAQTVPGLAVAQVIKDTNPETLTVMGGANCEAPMGAALATHAAQLDFVFSGPALRSFPEFLRRVDAIDDDGAACLHTIPGVISGQNAADPGFGQALGQELDIEEYIEPDYSAFIHSFDQMTIATGEKLEPLLFFETSRGCWWGERSHCTFCGLNGQGMGFRSMRPATALEQFSRLFRHVPWCQSFNCTDNIMPMDYLTEVFPHLRTPAGVRLFYEVKVGLDQEDLRTMAQAGVTAIQPGIEALSTSTLKLMRKGTSVFQNLQLLKNCVRYGIDPSWNLLIGFPGEPESTLAKYAEDLPLLTHLPPPSGCWKVRFDRYSPYYNQASDYGLELQPLDYYRLTYPFPQTALADLAYYFVDCGTEDYMLAAASWNGKLADLVDGWRERWYKTERPQLRLESDAEGAVIRDSRTTAARTVRLDRDCLALLEHLDRPARLDRLGAELPGLDTDRCLRVLLDNRLLLVEGNRAMNLVLIDSAADPMPRPRRTIQGTVRPGKRQLVELAAAGARGHPLNEP